MRKTFNLSVLFFTAVAFASARPMIVTVTPDQAFDAFCAWIAAAIWM